MRRLTAALAGAALLWSVAGCAATDGGSAAVAGDAVAPVTTAAAARAASVKQRGAHLSGRQLSLAVYYLRSFGGRRFLAPEWHAVPYTRAVAAAALGELLAGQPYLPDAKRPFPAGARLRSVQIEAGLATVDLSARAFQLPAGQDRRWPLQALVRTLTQVPTVQRVLVQQEGRTVAGPLGPDPALPLAPIALVAPAAGALVKGDRLVVRGEASVYEGTVGLRLRDDRGRVMAQSHATAAAGAPGRGPFAGALSFTPPATSHRWTLEAFEVSPEDGEVVYAVELPVWVGR
jgi:hypothetical protein